MYHQTAGPAWSVKFCQVHCYSQRICQFNFLEMKLRCRFAHSQLLVWDGYTSNFCIQVQVEFDKMRAFCVGTKKFNALMVLSHFIGSKPFLGGTSAIAGNEIRRRSLYWFHISDCSWEVVFIYGRLKARSSTARASNRASQNHWLWDPP